MSLFKKLGEDVVSVRSLRIKALSARALKSGPPRTDQLVGMVLLLSMNQSAIVQKKIRNRAERISEFNTKVHNIVFSWF